MIIAIAAMTLAGGALIIAADGKAVMTNPGTPIDTLSTYPTIIPPPSPLPLSTLSSPIYPFTSHPHPMTLPLPGSNARFISTKGTKENAKCSDRGLCDPSAGICTCYNTNGDAYGSSNGYDDMHINTPSSVLTYTPLISPPFADPTL